MLFAASINVVLLLVPFILNNRLVPDTALLVGANVTVKAQEAFAAILLVQPTTENCDASVPVIDRLVTANGEVPVFVTVIVPVVELLI
jgi:hypothetical protein